MEPKKPDGPICQSCGLPMPKPDDSGTNSDGSKNSDYCQFCYREGNFSEPNITMEQMIDICASIMGAKMLLAEDKAAEMARSLIPGLKRWKK